ncbi:MAG: arabinofuranosyltransferase [Solirubrobacteraceae bacterium]
MMQGVVPAPRSPTPLELLAGALAAAAALVLISLFVWGTGYWYSDPAAPGVGWLWAAVMVALVLGGYRAQQRLSPARARWVIAVLAGAAAGFVTAPLWVGLHGTPQPPFGVLRGDMTFRAEYVTRFASTWSLHDYTFGSLDAFYPPAWFWLAGRTAHLLDVEPWRIVKPFTIGTTGVALALAYVLWRRVLTPAGALAAAVGASLVLTRQQDAIGFSGHATQGWYSPYSCFVAVTGAGWLAATASAVRGGASRRGWALLAGVGALLALCYYLLFVILALALVGLALFPAQGRRVALARTARLLAALAALTAVFWLPLVLSVVGGAASQGHYLAPDFLQVQVAFNGPAELIVLAVAVVAALVLGGRWTAGRAVAGLIGAAIAWQLLSVTTLLLSENQLQPHRAVTLLWATLGAAVPVALEGMTAPGSLGRALPPAGLRAVSIVLAIVAAGATFVLGARQGADLATGPLTAGAHLPFDLETPREMGEFITGVTGRPADELTVLAGERSALLVIRPFNGFLALRARYAHPRARLAARVRAIETAASCPTAACVTSALTDTPFGAIDAVVARRVGGVDQIDTQVDAFPDPQEVVIRFTPGSFDPAVWQRGIWQDEVVYVRRP